MQLHQLSNWNSYTHPKRSNDLLKLLKIKVLLSLTHMRDVYMYTEWNEWCFVSGISCSIRYGIFLFRFVENTLFIVLEICSTYPDCSYQLLFKGGSRDVNLSNLLC